ncbi:FIST N-terminal domain-containing protein [uncultured Xylophilus sp.]|uniref:FIST signal transduction protein n=1 Tax=uncultured Xylophilus sp. TaxID=296832 RepID=UPI0025F416DD|nr:FIST N-terminal domain-containing protein [uncultured Xylophilus sp.]
MAADARLLFPCGHATHPQWRMAVGLVVAQLRAQMALPDHAAAPALGLLYITDHYADAAEELLAALRTELPGVTDWAGTVGIGIAVNNAEYFDEPALCVMLCDLPSDQYRVFSGVAPLGGFPAHTALLHADARTPDIAELIAEMAERTATGYLFGGLSASRHDNVQFAVGRRGGSPQPESDGVFRGGLSGVAFGGGVPLVSRVTQGCRPVGPEHAVTASEGNVITALDGLPALPLLLAELGVSLDEPQHALTTVRQTLVGLQAPSDGDGRDAVGRTGHFSADTRVRHIVGLDPKRDGVAVAEQIAPGTRMAFCQRNPQAARADLVRICAEIREELEPEELTLQAATTQNSLGEPNTPAARRIAGAVYVSCAGRGGPHFGAPNAEMQIVRHALGDVPLVGFFAGGEIARHHLYGYTGVLTVFVAPAGDDGAQ